MKELIAYYTGLMRLGKRYMEAHPDASIAFSEKYQAHEYLLKLLRRPECDLVAEGHALLSSATSLYQQQVYSEFLTNLTPEIEEQPQELEPLPMHASKAYIQRQRQRALKAGTPATLTLTEWRETLDYFAQQCAYCQRRPWKRMDHFVPISKGGGTTWDNCVPACDECDSLKRDRHPDLLLVIAPKDVCRVRQYLLKIQRKNA